MTLRLILIRHAKSSWDDPLADDHARVLNKRGHKSATAIGEWLTKNDFLPDHFVSSDAIRTQETVEGIMKVLPVVPTVRLSARLYHASPTTMQDVLHRQTARCLAMVGHNPGIGMAAHLWAQTPPDHPRFDDYPTAATTIMDFDCDAWKDVKAGNGKVVDFIVPRDLIGASHEDE